MGPRAGDFPWPWRGFFSGLPSYLFPMTCIRGSYRLFLTTDYVLLNRRFCPPDSSCPQGRGLASHRPTMGADGRSTGVAGPARFHPRVQLPETGGNPPRLVAPIRGRNQPSGGSALRRPHAEGAPGNGAPVFSDGSKPFGWASGRAIACLVKRFATNASFNTSVGLSTTENQLQSFLSHCRGGNSAKVPFIVLRKSQHGPLTAGAPREGQQAFSLNLKGRRSEIRRPRGRHSPSSQRSRRTAENPLSTETWRSAFATPGAEGSVLSASRALGATWDVDCPFCFDSCWLDAERPWWRRGTSHSFPPP